MRQKRELGAAGIPSTYAAFLAQPRGQSREEITMQERTAVMFYFTGVSFQNMAAMPEITRKLRAALADVGS